MKKTNIKAEKKQNKEKTSDVYFGFKEEVKNENVAKFEASWSHQYKEYRKKWEEYPKKLIIPKFPLHLDIGITGKCNLKCPMCHRTQGIRKKTWPIPIKDLNFDLYKKAIDEGSVTGLCAVNFDNFGEPLINPNIFKMIKYAKDKGILDVHFHTNATLLDKEKAIGLIESGLDKLIFSFDSPYKKKYEQIRVGAKFDEVVNNIKNFAKIKKDLGAIKPLTRINCINFPNTSKKEKEDMIKLMSPIVDSVSFIDYSSPTKTKDEIFSDDYVSEFICPQIITRLTVWEDGMISPCCADYDRVMGLGNLKNNSLESAWNSEKMKNIRKKHFEGKFFTLPACRKCDYAIDSDKESRQKKEQEK